MLFPFGRVIFKGASLKVSVVTVVKSDNALILRFPSALSKSASRGYTVPSMVIEGIGKRDSIVTVVQAWSFSSRTNLP